MKIDWTVSAWQVIAAIWVTFVFFYGVIRKLDRIIAIFEEYPPHKHVGNTIMFPKGMKPDAN